MISFLANQTRFANAFSHRLLGKLGSRAATHYIVLCNLVISAFQTHLVLAWSLFKHHPHRHRLIHDAAGYRRR
jgi:hypothetical protein